MNSSTRRSDRRRRIVAAAVAGAAVASAGIVVSGAFFTDSATITDTTFSFGTLNLVTTPEGASVGMGFSAGAPGDNWTGPITVANQGTLDLRYALETVGKTDTTGSGALLTALQLTVKEGAGTCSSATFGSYGNTVYTGPLNTGVGNSVKVLGDKAQGNQTGDRVLAATGSEQLCVQVSLPTTADNTVQGKSASVDFRFYAEQTSNNP